MHEMTMREVGDWLASKRNESLQTRALFSFEKDPTTNEVGFRVRLLEGASEVGTGWDLELSLAVQIAIASYGQPDPDVRIKR